MISTCASTLLALGSKRTSHTHALSPHLQILELKQQRNVMFERAVMSLRHPFLPRLLQAFQDKASLYLLSEFIPGGELFSRLADEDQLPISHAQFYAACTVEALSCLHAHRIIYRDVKPENLLICADGYLKLIDFG